uniref:Uncharacterized protein n=1 Tax=Anguilla anguilla TaxID=7936 RepID=A0A0E9UIS5_ANGAN
MIVQYWEALKTLQCTFIPSCIVTHSLYTTP